MMNVLRANLIVSLLIQPHSTRMLQFFEKCMCLISNLKKKIPEVFSQMWLWSSSSRILTKKSRIILNPEIIPLWFFLVSIRLELYYIIKKNLFEALFRIIAGKFLKLFSKFEIGDPKLACVSICNRKFGKKCFCH